MRTKPFVIGVSAIAGGGKSTLVKSLVQQLDNATSIQFDHYADDQTYPADIATWLKNGADYNAFNTPKLAADLQALCQGEPIISPQDGATIAPASLIVFEAPLGYAHKATGQFIDFLVFVDTPLEVGLARMVLRWFADDEDSANQAKIVESYLHGYLAMFRDLYLTMATKVKPVSDLVLDGLLSPELLTEKVMAALPPDKVEKRPSHINEQVQK
ncbi:MAG: hypothetical protein CL608_09685 [Anaerolineaceae bacterium]|nr:hypothetical protein [Anaerolineaceae bacterium]